MVDILVTAYGADPTGGQDSTEAFNAAIDKAKEFNVFQLSSVLDTAVRIVIPQGIYCVSSINASGLVGVDIVGDNNNAAIIYASEQDTPLPVLDLTGSSTCYLSGFVLAGENPDGTPSTVTPSCALLLGSLDSVPGTVTQNHINKVGTLGRFSKSAFVYAGAGETKTTFLTLQNKDPNGHCLYLSANNDLGVESAYQEVHPGPVGMKNNLFFNIEAHSSQEPGGLTPIVVSGTKSTRFDHCNIASSGPYSMEVYGDVEHMSLESPRISTDNGVPASGVLYVHDKLDGVIIDNPMIESNSLVEGAPLIQASTVSGVQNLYLRAVNSEYLIGNAILQAHGSTLQLGSAEANHSTNETVYYGGGASLNASQEDRVALPATNTTLVGARVRHQTAPGAGSLTFTIRKNGEDTPITWTHTGSTTESDQRFTLPVYWGDLLSIKVKATNAGLNEFVWVALLGI